MKYDNFDSWWREMKDDVGSKMPERNLAFLEEFARTIWDYAVATVRDQLLDQWQEQTLGNVWFRSLSREGQNQIIAVKRKFEMEHRL